MNSKYINIDIDKQLHEKIIAKQGDIGSRFLIVSLTENKKPMALTNRTVRVYCIKPDGQQIFNECKIQDAAKGIIVIEFTSQMLAIDGELSMELVIMEGKNKLSSIPFFIKIIKSINNENAVVSTNEFGALVVALERLDTYDKTIKDLIASWDAKFKTKYDNLNTEYAADITKAKADITKNTEAIAKNILDIAAKYDKNLGEATAQLATYLNTLVFDAMEGQATLLANMLRKINVRSKPMFEVKDVTFVFEGKNINYKVNCFRPAGVNLIIMWGKREIRKEGYWTRTDLPYAFTSKEYLIITSPVAMNNTYLGLGSSDEKQTNVDIHSEKRFSISVYPAAPSEPFANWIVCGIEA